MFVAFLNALMTFIVDNVPSPREAIVFGVPSFLGNLVALILCAWIRQRFGWRVAYTRKLFHFIVFFAAAGIQAAFGTRAVCVFGGAASLVLFAGLCGGRDGFLLGALARPSDAPYQIHFIVAPYFATLLGGVLSNALVGEFALFGYLVTGTADAIAEPIGTRWGKHRFRVLSRRGMRTERSAEGSLAVLVGSMIACWIGFILLPGGMPGGIEPSALAIRLTLLGLGASLIEAISPHGWDNFTLQLGTSSLAYLLMTS